MCNLRTFRVSLHDQGIKMKRWKLLRAHQFRLAVDRRIRKKLQKSKDVRSTHKKFHFIFHYHLSIVSLFTHAHITLSLHPYQSLKNTHAHTKCQRIVLEKICTKSCRFQGTYTTFLHFTFSSAGFKKSVSQFSSKHPTLSHSLFAF